MSLAFRQRQKRALCWARQVKSIESENSAFRQITAFDQDLTAPNNKVEYRLLSPKDSSLVDGSALFKIGSDSGQIVLQAPSLAEFAGSRLVFRVQALDGGLDGTELNSTVSVTVHVEGIRNKPELLPFPPKATGENGRQNEIVFLGLY